MMNHPLFKCSIPLGFSAQLEKHGHIRYGNLEARFEVQSPFVEMFLVERSELGLEEGKPILENYAASVKGYKTETKSLNEAKVASYPAYRVLERSDTSFRGQTLKITYHNICLILDEELALHLQFVYETKDIIEKEMKRQKRTLKTGSRHGIHTRVERNRTGSALPNTTRRATYHARKGLVWNAHRIQGLPL